MRYSAPWAGFGAAIGAGLALLALAGCAVGPNHERPATAPELPTTWTAQTEPVTGESDLRWWRAFGDEELNALVDEALARNADLEAAAARVLAAQASVGGATSALLPSLSLGATASRSHTSSALTTFPGMRLTNNMYSVTGTVSWEADLWGKLRRGRESALASLMASEQDRRWLAHSLTANVTLAWLQVKELRMQVELNERTVASYEENLQTVRDRYRRGLGSALELQLARQNLAAAQAGGPALRQQLAEARRALEVLAGRYPAATVVTGAGPTVLPEPLPPVPAGLPSSLLDRRPDLLAAESRLHAATAGIGQAKAALFPRFALTAEGGSSTREFSELLTDPTKAWSLVGNLVMPLINRGATQAQIKAAEAQARQAAATYRSAVLGALAEVENALDRDRHLTRQEELLLDSVEQARHSLDLAEDRYARGLDTLLVLLDAQRRLLTAESQLLSAERARRAARVQLILALGGPWTVEISPIATNEGADQ